MIHYDFKKRVALITGGAKGIGKACVEIFARSNAQVVIWDIDVDAGTTLELQLNTSGLKTKFFRVDTSCREQVDIGVFEVIKAFGQIDILINNAGILRDSSLKKMSLDQWNSVINVNLNGVYHSTQAIVPYMIEAKYGRIINAASIVAHNGNFGQSNYVATKSAVIGLTKVWARELGQYGITANAVAPGVISTEMMQSVPDDIRKGFIHRTPVKRMGTVEDVAQVYAFLASEQSSFINGVILDVSGGLLI